MLRTLLSALAIVFLSACVDKPDPIPTAPAVEVSASQVEAALSGQGGSTVCKQTRKQLGALSSPGAEAEASSDAEQLAQLRQRVAALRTMIADVCN